jgi:hypothetical protein
MRMPVLRFTAVAVPSGTSARKPNGPPSSISTPPRYLSSISIDSSRSSTPVMYAVMR